MGIGESAVTFLEWSSRGKVEEAFDRFVDQGFRHHLVYFKGDRETYKNAMIENFRQFPDKRYSALHVVEEGEMVAVHGKVEFAGKVYGVIHLFRFEGAKIMESWEASQEDLADSPNENGLF